MEELVGFTITGFAWYEDGYGDTWPRFLAKKGEEEVVIEVSRDEEGNGPGTLFITPRDVFEAEMEEDD